MNTPKLTIRQFTMMVQSFLEEPKPTKMNTGPIVLIEDDADDKDIVLAAFKELDVKNEIQWFDNCPDAWSYLKLSDKPPFVILCDVNLPKQTGMEFKLQVDEDPELRRKSIPFVLYSTSVDQYTVNEAYTKLTVQGFFKKENSFSEVIQTLKVILEYWAKCRHPNSV